MFGTIYVAIGVILLIACGACLIKLAGSRSRAEIKKRAILLIVSAILMGAWISGFIVLASWHVIQ